MDEIKAKQQVAEKIKSASKILVTVSDSPSVDALSAALGLAMLLEKQGKYATAIFSGETPPAIAFLEPEKTFDDTTDSLRDFIIALNKEKADHLRYKVEGDAVKIFITPYKTVITKDDFDFSQGDYNVELVIALGVDNQDHLDSALENHGKILHDAAIITMTAGDQASTLGGTDWHDSNSSSLSEMVAGLAESMKTDKKKPLLNTPIATALLTGIVSQTDRFSNENTTSKAMTVAATLMAAGADQQLIANELQAVKNIEVQTPDDSDDAPEDDTDVEEKTDTVSDDGSLTISRDKNEASSSLADSLEKKSETLADLDRRVLGDEKAKEKVTEEVEAIQEKAKQEEYLEEAEKSAPEGAGEPVLGGSLSATTEQAADDARREAENDQNKTILSHSYLGGAPDAPNSAPGNVNEPAPTPGGDDVHSVYAPKENEAPVSLEEPAPNVSSEPVAAYGGERVIQPLSEPQQTDEPPASAPDPTTMPTPEAAPVPNPTPADLGLPLPPPIPDFSQFNGVPTAAAPAIPLPQTQPPEILGDILAPESSVPDTSNAIPAPNTAYAPEPPAPEAQLQNNPADPGQFQIPPQ